MEKTCEDSFEVSGDIRFKLAINVRYRCLQIFYFNMLVFTCGDVADISDRKCDTGVTFIW